MEARAIVIFANIGEAARWLARYTTECSSPAYRALVTHDAHSWEAERATGVQTEAIAAEAARMLFQRFVEGR